MENKTYISQVQVRHDSPPLNPNPQIPRQIPPHVRHQNQIPPPQRLWMAPLLKKNEGVLDGLRIKHANVLIATSVVEEGVDVDACSFVIVFNHLHSTKT